jgi:cobalt-zinc-cadmium efflux system outer membrane protein
MLLLLATLLSLPAAAETLTLERAWQLAEEHNPQLRSARAALDAAQGELTDARSLLWNNPQLSAERRRREVPQPAAPAQNNREWSVGLSQTFEIAGQQGARRRAAEQSLAATQALIAETRRQLRAEVESRFVRVLSLQQRIRMEDQTLKLTEDAASAVGKRVKAGEDSRLDGNLSRVEAERAHNQVAALREQLLQARAELAGTLQLPADTLPEVGGALDRDASYTLDDLTAAAQNRSLLRALDHQEQAAKDRLGLERAAVYPDITLGLTSAREGPADLREKITGLGVSLPLPLFRRNATGIGRASTELTQAQVDRQAAQRDVPAQVIALWERLENLKSRVKRLTGSVLPSLEENKRLSAISFRAGEIGLLQLLLVNRQVLDGQRDLLDARTDLRLTQVALEAAAGWQSAPTQH